MPYRSERSGLLHRLKPSIWLEGAVGAKGVHKILSHTPVLGVFFLSSTALLANFGFYETALLPLWRLFHSNALENSPDLQYTPPRAYK